MDKTDHVTKLERIEDVSNSTMRCPFCNNLDNPYRSLMALMLARPIHYVKCESCGACGPLSVQYPDKQSAVDWWNKRFTTNEGEKDV